MFDPMSRLRFRKPRLRNWSVLAVASVWLLSVAGPADAATEIESLDAHDSTMRMRITSN